MAVWGSLSIQRPLLCVSTTEPAARKDRMLSNVTIDWSWRYLLVDFIIGIIFHRVHECHAVMGFGIRVLMPWPLVQP